jgi:hypothetical protein
MLRKALCAAAVLAFCCSLAGAEEFAGLLKKIEDGKITVSKFDPSAEKKFAEPTTLTLAKDVKVRSAKFNPEEKKIEPGEALPGGLKNERLQKLGERGAFCRFVTNAEGQVTEIAVLPAFKGKKKAQ